MKENQIKEINQHISDGLKNWSDIMILANADQWAYMLNYTPMDVFNAVVIFNHVLSNVGIKARRINEEKAEFLGSKIRKLVQDMTGLDPAEIIAKKGDKQ